MSLRLMMLTGLAMAGLCVPAAGAQTNPEHLEAMRTAIAAAGCVASRDNQRQIAEASGLDRQAGARAAEALAGLSELVAEGTSMRLVTGACAGTGAAAPGAEVLAARRATVAEALAGRDCRVGQREVAAFATGLGFTRAETAAALLEMVQRGEGRMEAAAAGDVFVLTSAPCGGAVVPPPALSK